MVEARSEEDQRVFDRTRVVRAISGHSPSSESVPASARVIRGNLESRDFSPSLSLSLSLSVARTVSTLTYAHSQGDEEKHVRSCLFRHDTQRERSFLVLSLSLSCARVLARRLCLSLSQKKRALCAVCRLAVLACALATHPCLALVAAAVFSADGAHLYAAVARYPSP